MKSLVKLWMWLNGKKTYLISLLTALDGLWQYYVQNGMSTRTLVVYLLFGGGLASLRHSMAKKGE